MAEERPRSAGARDLPERISERIAAGEVVDWQALGDEHPELAPRLRGLRRVEEIEAAFRRARQPGVGGDREPDVHPPDRPGWGPFELGEKLGEGSFGEVYRAYDATLGRHVALKLARQVGPAGESRPLDCERFLEEGQRLARLDHPGILRVFGAAVHDGRAGMWTALADGRPLDRRLEQDGRFSEAEVVEVGRQLCAALAAVHAEGLVHGDVKASNVLRRDGGAVVLGDFGSSVDLRGGPERPGSATPLCAAPEVLRGEPATGRSDLYSSGVLLYRLLTGEYPFRGEDLEEVMRSHREGTFPALRALRPEISPALARAVEKALAPNPQERWRTAAEMADALGRAAVQPVHRHRWRWPALAAGLLVLAGLFRLAGPWAPGPGAIGDPGGGEHAVSGRVPSADGSPGWRPAEGGGGIRLHLYRAGSEQALRSGDRIRLGDALHLEIEGNLRPLWIYVVNEDDQGHVYRLFPVPGAEPANPLPAGDLRLPGRLGKVEQDWVVTSEGATESFLFVASRQPLPRLENELARLDTASPERRAAPSPVATLELTTGGTATRGVGGLEAAVESARPATLLRLGALARESATAPSEPEVALLTLRGTKPPP